MSRPESPALPRMADPNRSPVYSDRFHLSYQNILLLSFRFRVSNYTEAFSNGRPINIYSYTIHYEMIYKTIVQSLTFFVHKMSHVQKEMICIWRGIYLYATNFSMTLRFLILPDFLFTRNPRIDKNYTLNIFMLSGSIQLYSNFQFNMTCISHKTMPFISNYTQFIFTCFHFTNH